MTASHPQTETARCFSDDVRQMFAALDKLEIITSIEASYSALIDRRSDFIAYGDPAKMSERNRAWANLAVIRQVQIHRAERLIASSGTMLAERNVYGLVLLIRGHFESTAIIGYLCDRLSSFLKGNIPFETIIFDIAHTMMGAKHEFFAEMPDPINVLTALEKADRYIQQSGFIDTKGMLADCYGWLSEFAHPNFNSSDSALRLNRELRGFEFRHGGDLSAAEIQMLGYLDISASVFTQVFDDLSRLSVEAFGEIEGEQ